MAVDEKLCPECGHKPGSGPKDCRICGFETRDKVSKPKSKDYKEPDFFFCSSPEANTAEQFSFRMFLEVA